MLTVDLKEAAWVSKQTDSKTQSATESQRAQYSKLLVKVLAWQLV